MQILNYGAETSENKGHIVISLHGFPGQRSRQNREFAQAIYEATGGPVQVLLYNGLGFSEGDFRFSSCLNEVRAHFAKLVNGGVQSVDLVGHSWGGFMSICLAAENPGLIRKLALLSPLLKFAGPDLCVPAFVEAARSYPSLSLAPANQLGDDFVRVGQGLGPIEKLLSRIPESVEILFLQAREDDITPAGVATGVLSHFRRPPLFELVDTDHSFVLNREELARRVAGFIVGNGV